MSIQSYLTAPVPRWVAFVAVASSTTAAVAGTYVVLKRQFEEEYQSRLEKEIRDTKVFVMHKAAIKEQTVEELDAEIEATVSEAVELMKDYNPDARVEGYKDNLREITKNVFTNASTRELEPEEILARNTLEPYIVSEDEFAEGEYITVNLEYYLDDQCLITTEDTQLVDNVDKIVGEENLTKFGHGSGDPTLVYVRNDVLEVDYEITKCEGSYAQIHLGGGIEHSAESFDRRRKFRNYED